MMDNTIKLKQLTSACPEQYEAYLNEIQVGYLRLRHGYFYVQCPDDNGQILFDAYPDGDGMFKENELKHYLDLAVSAIQTWVIGQSKGLIIPDGNYEVSFDNKNP